MVLPRCVEPEWGDRIPAGDPLAQRLRRDLQRINALAMTDRPLADALLHHCGGEPPRTILDLGSGDGTVMLRLAQRLSPRWKSVTVTLLDQQDFVSPETRAAFAALGWTVETKTDDVFRFLGQAKPGIDVITANGFLHHFHEPQLSTLLALAARVSRLIVAAEPRRTRFCLRLSWWVWVLGVSSVFRQDLITSIKAGFKHQELSALMARDTGWTTEESDPSAFIHLFVAKRRAAG